MDPEHVIVMACMIYCLIGVVLAPLAFRIAKADGGFHMDFAGRVLLIFLAPCLVFDALVREIACVLRRR